MDKELKIYLITIISVLIIIGICIAIFIINKNNTVWITDYEFLYDKAIEYVIKQDTSESYDKNKEGFKIFCDYVPFGIEEKGNKKYAYMWILEEEYYVENNNVEMGEGSSIPYKFVFENNEVAKYEIPSDGSKYGPSIKKIFPKSLQRKAMSFSMDSSNLRKEVEEYYSYLQTSDNTNFNVDSNKHYSSENDDTVIMNAIVVRVDEKSLKVVTLDSAREILSVRFTDEGNIGYKQGQEIKIYYDGMILTSYPGEVEKVYKIEIVKDKSDTEIPKEALRYCYSSKDNVNVEISELTNNGIYLKIIDTNEVKYDYSHKYEITKEVKNPNYTGVGYYIGEDTATSTRGYTGTGSEYIWEEVDKISNISSENTEIIRRNTSKDLIDREFDWTELYGKLEERKI